MVWAGRAYFVVKAGVLTMLLKGQRLLRSVLAWLRHFTPKLRSTNTAFYNGVMSNRMKQILILFIFVISTQSNADESPFYVGTWQSNEEKTLASMNEVHDIPENTKLFLRDNFFGRLVNVVREDTFAAYFIGERPDKLVFRPYDVEVLSNSTIRITYYDEFTDSNVIQTLTFEENCYSLHVSKWNFKEYFCREN